LMTPSALIEDRYQKFRRMGSSFVEESVVQWSAR
jgi:hypothetical protein